MTSSATARVDQASLALSELQDSMQDLHEQLHDDVEVIETKHHAAREDTLERTVTLEKNDVEVRRLGLLWIPINRRL
jgi:hypothetical protein